jgi:hypothetical protein
LGCLCVVVRDSGSPVVAQVPVPGVTASVAVCGNGQRVVMVMVMPRW